MQNFFMDHCQDAFGCMGEILGENFNFKQGVRERYRKDSASMWKVKNFLDMLKFKICQQSYSSRSLNAYSVLLSDVVHSVPPELLGALLYEELTEQRDRLLFSEGATGGALAFIPFSQSSSGSQHGCLLYPGNQGLDRLNFHRVELQHHRGSSSILTTSSDPISFQLKGPIRQISSVSLFDNCCVAVRSDHLCGVWRFSERNEPRLLQVVNTREVATCISVSPHILGEVLVASESGAANLWTVGKGMQKVREEDSNLYFNAKSSWRWCEFSAHPRVMLYADRTGVELTDIRASPTCSHTLFRISNSSECRSGERLILSKYLGDVHSFHHLITTQFSAYIMDERFPSMPMLKWDHMMHSPPMFCHVLLGSASSGSTVGGARTNKVLLGSQSSQEITLLQYSGGRAEACFSRGPAQALLRPKDSLKHLPVQIPHRLDTATNRLSSPAAGMTCVQKKGGKEAGGEECICILQLTEAGDIFYQILEPDQPDANTSRPPAAEDEPLPQQAATKLTQPTLKEVTTSGRKTAEKFSLNSQLIIADTSSDEDIIGPTQGLAVPRFVSETPEKEQQGVIMYSDSEDSESGGKSQKLKHLGLQVIVNDDPELDHANGLDSGVKDGKFGGDKADDTEEARGVEETVGSSNSLSRLGPCEQQTQVKLSKGALITWKHWLQKLIQKSRKKKPHPRSLQHFTIKTKGFLHLANDEARDSTEEERVQSLRRDLRASMYKRSLLVHSTVSNSLRAPDVVLMPNLVDTEVWRDQLSRRLTLSWQGEEAWRAWWEDHLGLNREEKVKALKRKRRREKDAKRAAGRCLELSGSFTSSVSYQSDLDNFSDSTGWSSAASQRMWSDTEGTGPLSQLEGFSEHGTPRATTPSKVQNDTPVPTPSVTPRSVKDKQGDHQTPRSSNTPSLSQTTAASQRRITRPAEDYLSSLFAPQDEPSQHNINFLEEGSTIQPPPGSSSSQLRSSQSVPQRILRVDLSQDSSIRWGFSQSLSLSQSSQGRLGLSQASQASQASQPKKKKSRMGF
ncbi:TATA box-binding protein-associated factor RNA polymerase I subunit C isoform X2 [Xiphias gladius]|nr:TATA box-binding protein-associated factor RNA polymerase I subunit C isoform X2 [Xiphias gladius]XP_040012920.1 TATA box-binding protein-associated factor RNA polymerase I subunit C isoform X2 [Xiphias gladius]XP_040012921.1 TATA box-binding protein-associated factor RNA polymerase I subunit C isoform X2 [Xiphias gladius]XP_040012922.1 TATA box-binding protein-associated factor RNA polymerase I subunit C isoform X2 [Xiphias gladius]